MELNLFEKSELEVLEAPLQEIEDSFVHVKDLISLKTDDSEVLAILQNKSIQGEHEIITKGIVYGILLGLD